MYDGEAGRHGLYRRDARIAGPDAYVHGGQIGGQVGVRHVAGYGHHLRGAGLRRAGQRAAFQPVRDRADDQQAGVVLVGDKAPGGHQDVDVLTRANPSAEGYHRRVGRDSQPRPGLRPRVRVVSEGVRVRAQGGVGHAVVRDSELVVQHRCAVRHQGDVATDGGAESRQYGAPEQGAVVRPLRAVVGPEIEVAEVVVHHGREVERAGRDHRLDEERAYRAVHVQDVGANPTKGVLQAAQRDLGALSRTQARLQPVDGDAPVLVCGRGFAFGWSGPRPPSVGRSPGGRTEVTSETSAPARVWKCGRWFSSYPNPSRYDPMTCATRMGDTPPSSRRVALARAVTIPRGSAVSCPAVSDSTRRTVTRSESIRLRARPPIVSSVSFCAILYRFYLGGGITWPGNDTPGVQSRAAWKGGVMRTESVACGQSSTRVLFSQRQPGP